MADEKPSLGNIVLIHNQVTNLAVHFGYGLHRPRTVVRCAGEILCALVLGELEIRHVDVNHAFKQPERLQCVVTAGVVDDWNAKSASNGGGNSLQNLRHDMRWCDEIDVAASFCLQMAGV